MGILPRISSLNSNFVSIVSILTKQLKNDFKLWDAIRTTRDQLGTGNNGAVMSGYWRNKKVAVKGIKKDNLTDNDREAKLLELDHPNVVKLYHTEIQGDKKY